MDLISLQFILDDLSKGSLNSLSMENKQAVSFEAVRLIEKDVSMWSEYDLSCADLIISISQMVYDNASLDALFLEDGVYDLLLTSVKNIKGKYQVGASVVQYDDIGQGMLDQNQGQVLYNPVSFIGDKMLIPGQESPTENFIFYEDIYKRTIIDPRFNNPRLLDNVPIMKKKTVSEQHIYPDLVGTLDKCKFVLDREAIDANVYDKSNVTVFERDFLAKHLLANIIDRHHIELDLEIKYDGVAVEAECTNKIISARSRGDTETGVGADLTPLLGGYVFPNAREIPISEAFGIQFEAIITKYNLERLCSLTGKVYKNGRNAIIGILSSSDAYKYREFITLVPLRTSLNVERSVEIAFLNKYYTTDEPLRYSIISGSYENILFQVYRFVKEAEALRAIVPYMYDGVVVSYTDPAIIQALGRKDSVNQFSIAIKFNAMVKSTTFTGYSFTVGSSGRITPMIHFIPVEFNGQIHPKASGHSYARFKELNLAIGDRIELSYNNDVMPYVCNVFPTGKRPPEEFIKECPYCGTKITLSETGSTAYCNNTECPARRVSKMRNMFERLGIKGFGDVSISALNINSIHELARAGLDRDLLVPLIGEAQADKLIAALYRLFNEPINDFRIVSALGFPGIASNGWRDILTKMPLDHLINTTLSELQVELGRIGVGIKTANVIVKNRDSHLQDLMMICDMKNVIRSYGSKPLKTICFSGVRDTDLEEKLSLQGYKISNGYVTSKTDILLVPHSGFTSSKTKAAGENTKIIPIDVFKSNMEEILRE